jgi:RecA-family ATPase
VKIDVNDFLRNYGCDALRNDIDARSQRYEPNGPSPDEWPCITFIDPATWHGKPIPERQWLIQDLIPAANVTLLTGHGAAGKTTLALQLAAATALGRPWLGYMPERGHVMVICCEDDEAELHRRLACITDRLGASLVDLQYRFRLATLAGREALLGVPDRGVIVPTPLLEEISAQASSMRPKLIVMDNAADVYGGDENSRAMVRQFITLLRGLAIDSGAAVLLTLHPSLTGLQTGDVGEHRLVQWTTSSTVPEGGDYRQRRGTGPGPAAP